MGSKASTERAESPSAVMIVLAGGKVETYNRPVSALKVMLRHPRHVLTHPDAFRSDIANAVVTPETVLLPGNKYFLVPFCRTSWLVGCQVSPTRMPFIPSNDVFNPGYGVSDLNDGLIFPIDVVINHCYDITDTVDVVINGVTDPIDVVIDPSYGATGAVHGVINPGYGVPDPLDGVAMSFHGTASPQPQVVAKHRRRITVTIKQPHPARGRIAKGKRGKIPLRAARSSESCQRLRRNTPKVCPGKAGAARSSESCQRLRRNTPKVCPGKAGAVWIEQELAINPSFSNREAMVKNEGIAWKGKTLVHDESALLNPHEDRDQLSIIDLKSKDVYKDLHLLHCGTPSKASNKMNPNATLGYYHLQLSSLSGDETNDGSEREPSPGTPFNTSSPVLASSPRDAFPKTSTHMLLIPSPKEEVPSCSSPWTEIVDHANAAMLHKEKNSPEVIKVCDLTYDQPNLLQEPEGAPQNMALFELLNYPDLNPVDLLEDGKVDSLIAAPSPDIMDAHELHEADVQEKEDTSGNLLLEPINVHDLEGVMPQEQEEGTPNQTLSKVSNVSELHQEDSQQKEFQFHVSLEDDDDHPDSGVQMVLKHHNMVQADVNKEEWQGTQELQQNIMTCDVIEASVYQQKCVTTEDCNLAVPTLPDIETGELQGIVQDQQKDLQVGMARENCHDQQASNLSLPLEVVGGLQKSMQPSVCMEEGVLVLGCQPEKILSEIHGCQDKYVVDGSNKARPTEEVKLEQRLTLSDYFVRHSLKHQHMIDLGVVADGMNQCFMSGTSSSLSSSSEAASSRSLAWFMGMVSPHVRRSDQVSAQQVKKTGASKQQNLAILGFKSLRSDSLSIFEQVKAHKKAHWLRMVGKSSSSCHAEGKGARRIGSMKSEVQQSSKTEQEQGRRQHLPQQQEQHEEVEKQQALPPAIPPPPPSPSPPPSPPTHHLGLPRRFFHHKIRPFRCGRPPRKPLSPIMEFASEMSSASASPLNSFPSL